MERHRFCERNVAILSTGNDSRSAMSRVNSTHSDNWIEFCQIILYLSNYITMFSILFDTVSIIQSAILSEASNR